MHACLSYTAGNTKTKLLEQPIPASFLRLEEVVRHIAANCKQKNIPPVLKEQDFRYQYIYIYIHIYVMYMHTHPHAYCSMALVIPLNPVSHGTLHNA